MFGENGPIDFVVKAHITDAHKTSPARQESTTRQLYDSTRLLCMVVLPTTFD